MGMVTRGEIWLTGLDPTVGSEIQKNRPCVIISPPELNNYLRTVIVAPMTTGSQKTPFRVSLDFQGKSGLILLDQIRTLDKTRLIRKLGMLDGKTVADILSVMQEFFAE